MAKYRKKPVVIEAFKFGFDEQPKWFAAALEANKVEIYTHDIVEPPAVFCFIETLEGKMTAIQGDMIIKGISGEIYPCKADIFAKTYEFVTN
jgi:hypothetical protein